MTERIAGYRLLRPLGKSRTAAVFEALDSRTGARVALWILDSNLASDAESAGRFLRRAQIASEMRSPYMHRVLGFGTGAGAVYAVTEYAPGVTLAELLAAYGTLPARLAADVGYQAARALEEGERLQLVHGDLHPGTILVTPSGTAKILGYGSGLPELDAGGAADEGSTYLAPEVLAGQSPSAQSDLYALGAILDRTIAGTAAGNLADDAAGTRERGESAALREVLNLTLQVAPGQRYAGAAMLRAALQPLAAGRQMELRAEVAAFAKPLLASDSEPAEMTADTGEAHIIGQRREAPLFAVALAVVVLAAGLAWQRPWLRSSEAPLAHVAIPASARPVERGLATATLPTSTPSAAQSGAPATEPSTPIATREPIADRPKATTTLRATRYPLAALSLARLFAATEPTDPPVAAVTTGPLRERGAQTVIPAGAGSGVLGGRAPTAPPESRQPRVSVEETRVTGTREAGDTRILVPALATPAAPEPPVLLAPGDGEERQGFVRLAWSPVAGAESYVAETRSTRPDDGGWRAWPVGRWTELSIAFDRFPDYFHDVPTTFYWRVSAIGSGGMEGRPSNERRFVFQRRAAPAPTMTPRPPTGTAAPQPTPTILEPTAPPVSTPTKPPPPTLEPPPAETKPPPPTLEPPPDTPAPG